VPDARTRAEAEARVARATAALSAAQKTADAARAEARLAVTELERMRKLYTNGDVSRTQLDQAETQAQRTQANLKAATFQIDVARHELDAARTALAYGTGKPDTGSDSVAVSSPVNGCVIDIAHESEGVVDAGQPLLSVGDARSLEVVVDVLSQQAVRIRTGMPVDLLRWGGGKTLAGRVRIVEPVGFTKISALGVEEQRVRVIVDITSPPGDWTELGDGYRVDARFIVWSGDNVLQIPASALFRTGNRWAVFRVVNGKAATTPVTTGHEGELNTEITAGLKAGETVVLHPDSELANGVRVAVRETESDH
jgi:HlyD family secretion protein